MKYDIDGHLWWAPTPKLGGGWILAKDSPEPPKTPDPAVVSGAQTASNVETARVNAALNRVNQKTPYGSVTYQNPGLEKANSWETTEFAKWQAQQQADPNWQARDDQWKQLNAEEHKKTLASANPYAAERDKWESTITLSPEQQALQDSDTRIKTQLGAAAEQGLGRVTDAMGRPLDTSKMTGYRDIPTSSSTYTTGLNGGNIQRGLPNSDYAGQRTRVEDAVLSRVNPQLQRDRQALDARLANQGIMPGSEAYTTAIDESTRQANDARMGAVLAGGQEQSRLAGLDLQAGQFTNAAQAQDFGQQATNASLNNGVQDRKFDQGMQGAQASAAQRQQQLQEAAFLRNLPLNELNALRTGAQVNNPSFSPVPQTNVAGTNTGSNVWSANQGQNNAYNQQIAANNANTQAAASLAGAGLSAWGTAAAGGGAAAAGALAFF